MIPRRRLHLLVVPALCAACAAPDPPGAAKWAGTVEMDAGAAVVRNPAAPLLRPGAAGLEPLWSVRGGEGAAADAWQRPSHLALGGGEVYVLDPPAGRVYAVAGRGARVRTLGREGSGPGELKEPFGLAYVGGMVAIGDGGRGSVELWRPDGGHLRSLPLRSVGFSLQGLADGRLLVNGIAGRDAPWRVVDTLGGRRTRSLPRQPRAGRGDAVDCMRVSAAGPNVLVMNCTVPAFRVVDGRDRVLREIRIDRPAREMTPAEERRVERGVAAGVAGVDLPPEQARAVVRSIVERQRTVRAMRAARQDLATGVYALLEQDPAEIGGGSGTLHLLSPQGVYLAALPLDARWVDFAVDGGTVYALAEDPDTGLAGLAAYRLRLPADALDLARRAVGLAR